jgi:hypothetical protein
MGEKFTSTNSKMQDISAVFFSAQASLETAEVAKNVDLRGNHGKTK